MTYDLFVGVLGNALFFVTGFLLQAAITSYRRRYARRLFRHFSRGAVRVVLSTRPGPKASSTSRVSLSETRSFAAFQRLFAGLGRSCEPSDSEVALIELSGANVVVLGGPVANRITGQLWPSAAAGVPYAIDAEHQVIRALPSDFVPEYDATGELTVDFGIIIRRRNPINPEHGLLIAAGCHGFGTEACVAMVTQRDAQKKLASRTKGEDFAAIVRAELRDRQIVSLTVAQCVILSSDTAAGGD